MTSRAKSAATKKTISPTGLVRNAVQNAVIASPFLATRSLFQLPDIDLQRFEPFDDGHQLAFDVGLLEGERAFEAVDDFGIERSPGMFRGLMDLRVEPRGHPQRGPDEVVLLGHGTTLP